MDENYLDNLLNEISLDKEIDHKIEDELDSQMQKEKQKQQEQKSVSKEDAFSMDLEKDAEQVFDDGELHFSEEQMDELDQLDHFADLDIGDLDFSDIDFNDLDITKLDDVKDDDFDDILKDFEGDFKIDDFFDEEKEAEQVDKEDNTAQSKMKEAQDTEPQEVFEESSENEETKSFAETEDETVEQVQEAEPADLDEDAFDADTFLDSLLEETETPDPQQEPVVDLTQKQSEESAYDAMEAIDGFNDIGQVEIKSTDEPKEELQELSRTENEELDDLFSMLDLEENGDVSQSDPVTVLEDVEPELSIIGGLEDIDAFEDDTNKKRKGLTKLLFGEPDEDDILSEEELAQIEAKKEAKKAKKEAAKEAKKEKAEAAKEEKALKNGIKQKEEVQKRKIRAEKKAKQKAEEAANAEPAKKLNTPMVIFIFSLFLGGTFLFYMASNNFNYTQAIEKAAQYFASQKYRSAYDEIKGVEVKEKDQDLKNRIYTVMYVERLCESYENNTELGRPEKALDALLRGVSKYYEHYEEAEELGIVNDLNYSFSQIQSILSERYGITLEQALAINALENNEYVQTINSYIASSNMEMDSEEGTSGGENTADKDNNPIDAALPEEKDAEE